MANKRFLLGILITVLVFGLTVVGCGGDSSTDSTTNDNKNIGGGTFTLTDIPAEYNGWYVSIDHTSPVELVGIESYDLKTDTFTVPRIKNGNVSIPMWIFYYSNDGYTVERFEKYSGNHTVEVEVEIYVDLDQEGEAHWLYFPSVNFSNGNARKSWDEGKLDYEYW